MSSEKLASIVLAAGEGKRLKSKLPKALHQVCGKPMLQHIVDTLRRMRSEPIVLVVGYAREHIQQSFAGDDEVQFVYQEVRGGTGHAVLTAAPVLADWDGDILVLNGDCPLIREETLRRLAERHRRADAAATILTAILDDPTGYGRVLRSDDDDVLGIVEHRDCNRYERKIPEINAGFYCFKAADLFPALQLLRPNNDQAELYLTDVIQILVQAGKRVEAYTVPDPTETFGVNDRVQLAVAERILRQRINEQHMLNGVTIQAPDTTFIDDGVTIGQDTIVRPFTVLEGSTSIGNGCRIGPSAHLINCIVGDGAHVRHCVAENQRIPAGSTVDQSNRLSPAAVRNGDRG